MSFLAEVSKNEQHKVAAIFSRPDMKLLFHHLGHSEDGTKEDLE